jgi:chaperonin GroES
VESSFPIPQRRNRRRARSWRSAKARPAKTAKKIALDIKEGDRILFGKYSGTEVKIEGEEYLIMREDDVLGVIE